jgi:Zn-dependent M28 family amino/carboxypeptidase
VPRRLSSLLLALAVVPIATRAQAPVPISTAEIDAHIRFLSSDLLEGRGPASRGGALTEEYIAAQLRSYGVAPAHGGTYFQRVPIDIVAADRATMRVRAGNTDLRFPDDVVIWAGSTTAQSGAKAPVVFVGYGSTAPEYRWDDFKNVDVKGKILLVLVNDPPAPAAEPNLFGGRAMTYYGRWTYKFEEAERRGAAGMLIIHDTERAGYGWATVAGSWATPQRMLPRDPMLPAPLGFRGWITGPATESLLKTAGLDLATLRRQAESRSFRPIETGITLDVAFTNAVSNLSSNNVVGVVEGNDPEAKKEHILLTAHWDHHGIGLAVNGDSIYNGALDNASGVADLLAVARQLAQGPRPKRSVLFAFVTAEESGLLGSEFLGLNPLVPSEDIVANLNVDGGNVLGESRDLRILGDTKSSLGPQIGRMVAPRGMSLSPDAFPERGFFYRSDHFSLAKAGIPAISIGAGQKYVGRPDEWGIEQANDYNTKRYHQPEDQYDPTWDLRGAVQLSNIVLEFTRLLAESREWPTWNADAEFKRPARRPAM